MEVDEEKKTGFKDTVLGVLPVDWELKSLADIGRISSGGTPDTSNAAYWNGDVNWCTPTDIGNLKGKKHIENTVVKISHEGLKKSSAELLPINSLITCTRATIGKVAINKQPIATNQGFKNLTPVSDNVDFLYYRLIFDEDRLIKIASGSTFLEISKKDFSKFIIPIPKQNEQKAIADCLSTWDNAIEKLSALIGKKELQKKALMQQLLTGKKRLKGFSGEWKEVHIWDIASEVSIRNKTNEDLTVLSCTKYDGLVPSLEYFGRRIYSDDLTTYKVVPQSHFAYATNHIEEGSIGYQDRFTKALISPMYTVFKTDKTVDDGFFFRLLKSHKLMHEYNVRMEGSIDRRGGLRWDAFSIIKIHIPALREQEVIAAVLQQADKEITLLQTKLDKLKQQKKGLMQVLLTGKKRLKF